MYGILKGRALAWQEMIIILALIFQRFDLVMDDPSYELKLKQTLTIKPKDFHIRALPRKGRSIPLATSSSSLHKARLGSPTQPTAATVPVGSEPRQQLYVLYGSNTGTSEAFAQRVASDASAHGAISYLWLDLFADSEQASVPRWEHWTRSRRNCPLMGLSLSSPLRSKVGLSAIISKLTSR